MEQGSQTEKLFATVRKWPPGLDSAGVVALLTKAGIGAYECNQLVKRTPPFLLGRVTRQFMLDVMPRLEAAGVCVSVLTEDHFDRVPKAVLAKSLLPALGAPKPLYAVEAWRGQATSLLMEEVVLLVRASVLQQTTRTQIESSPRGIGGTYAHPMLGLEGAIVAEALDPDEADFGGVSKTTTTSGGAAEVVDMYRLDGTRIRIHAQKFNFEMLGSSRGKTGRDNLDQLMVKLGEEAANAEIDLEFAQFKAPPGLSSTKSVPDISGANVSRIDQWPSFEFYSLWRYLLMRIECGLEP